ncbi:MAG TPA: hypothetical protein DCQ32_04475 [Cyanobacteria bacterium UBA8156]|jgi:hypothetical protein|nr:hypothetical protein [Cyanobacteria bacterium UBA8156]
MTDGDRPISFILPAALRRKFEDWKQQQGFTGNTAALIALIQQFLEGHAGVRTHSEFVTREEWEQELAGLRGKCRP